ncbi:TPA: ABC transporter ATP-binding protein, partial [Acinetobacter baumannii]|nr:ABC transporter ATP-binding protein [Acinetobacter baumannii]HEC0424094.1 ABC transporter ATP-binding protein [Acinetobacter baumannii]
LLYMIYEMGRSVKKGYKAIFMQTYYFALICWGGLSIILLVLYILDANYSWGSFFDLISWVLLFLILAFLFMGFINYFAYRKSYENFGNLSEQIFEKLGFENPKEQDFYNDYLINDGINISVMDYRKNLKGKDPYPEDYFDKKNF